MKPCLRLDSLKNHGCCSLNGILSLYVNKLALLAVELDKGLGLFVINLETRLHSVGVVVLALNKGAAAIVANSILLRLKLSM